jgi:toxin ParE1/3/4
MRVDLTGDAKADLREIEEYVCKDNIAAAERLIEQLEALCLSLGDNPRIGTKRDYLPGLRSIAEGNYVIFYSIQSDSVRVLRVLYGARDIDQIFQTSDHGL